MSLITKIKKHVVWVAFGCTLLLVGAVYLIYLRGDRPNVEEQKVIQVEEVGSLSLLFVGDIMLDRGVRIAINREGADYPFGDVASLFDGHDLVVGNLEGTFTSNASLALPGSGVLRFTFDPALAQMLKKYKFDGFSLANNHALDFGRSGLDETKRVLAEAGFFSFGSPSNDLDISHAVKVGGESLCFVGYHSLFREAVQPVVSEIERLRPGCEYIVVYAHWGDEYQDSENSAQRRQGRAFVDAGADLVIGHHPHVVQPVEIYNGKAIFYSLGNFLFDQDFSLPTRQGLAVRLTLSKDSQSFDLIPIEMSRARLYYPGERYQSRMNVLTSKLPDALRDSVETTGQFTILR
jgi:poly-gamma-glutamate capsule biosynthesis protein CapA/YwtB (metallophosphatase superfamily)